MGNGMRRILFVQNTSAIGGASFCMLNIIRNLNRTKFQPAVLLPADGPLSLELKKIGVEVFIMPSLRGIPYNRDLWKLKYLLSYLLVFRCVIEFKRFLSSHLFDIVYLNSMVLHPYLRPAKNKGCRTVIHIREHWPLREHVVQLSYARRNVRLFADKLLAINEYSASIFPAATKKASIVYDWIDFTDRFEPRSFSDILGEDAFRLKVYLYTGGFDQFKGPREVFKAFSSAVTDKNARLLVLGDKPKNSTSKYMKEAIKILEEDSRIVCIPRTYKIKHIIEQAYCVLSSFTVPHANLGLAENIILNKITIAADNEEAREYSLNGELAILFTPNNIDDFIRKIQILDDVYEEYTKKLYKNSVVIKKKFDKEENLKILECVFDGLN